MITKTKAQSWRTPPAVFAGLHADYSFTVDGAASLGNALLPRFWTKAHAGGHGALGLSWRGERAFINPPFGMIRDFLDKALDEAGEAFSCFVLPANVDTKWFHEVAVYADKHVFRGRVCYLPPPGVDVSTPSFPSMIAMFGPDVRASGLGFSRARSATTGALLPAADEVTLAAE